MTSLGTDKREPLYRTDEIYFCPVCGDDLRYGPVSYGIGLNELPDRQRAHYEYHNLESLSPPQGLRKVKDDG